MREYPKIDTIYKRDLASQYKTLIEGEFSRPEFAYLENCEWEFTEKVDGTNIRVMIQPGQRVSFGGKTDNASLPAPLVKRLEDRFAWAPANEKFPSGAYLYGEGYGAKIQKGGGNYRPDQDFVLFDVLVGNFWLERADVEDVATTLGLDVVPAIGRGDLREAIRRARDGFCSRWGDFEAEGIVARPAVELRNRAGERIITKIKCRDFLRPA